jgi:hypothetical protein
MKTSDGVFPGRILFDHLPKTAGQAVNAWLNDALGAGCVTTNLVGDHRDLIRRYGGQYSLISAHVHFRNAESLDPRYQYITLFRDPVDRAISWCFYVANDVESTRDTFHLKDGAIRFLASDGVESSPQFLASITNPYTEHFCRITGDGSEPDEERLANALMALKQYDVVGVYESMSRFVADVAGLVGLPPPTEIARVNVTSKRSTVDGISPALRQRIVSLNQLDLRLYAEVVAWKAATLKSDSIQTSSPTTSKWQKYEPVLNRVMSRSDIAIHGVALREGYEIRNGQLMTFDLDFSLTREVSDLEMGIHVFDSDRRLAFGTNSTLLGQENRSLPSGSYRVSHHVVADLPAGKYSAGFAFAERLPTGPEELAWRDVMCEFQVYQQKSQPFAGHCYLPAKISLRPLRPATEVVGAGLEAGYCFQGADSRLYTAVGRRIGHEIACTGQAGHLIYGPYMPLAAGHYRLVVRGTLGEGGLGGARLDVTTDKGERVIAESVLVAPGVEGCFAILPISLAAACTDLEVRVWVGAETDLRISMIEIDACPSDEAASPQALVRQ